MALVAELCVTPPPHGAVSTGWRGYVVVREKSLSVLEINDVMILIFASRESVDDFTVCQIIALKKKKSHKSTFTQTGLAHNEV